MTPNTENILMLRRARRVLSNPDDLNVMSCGQIAMMAFALNRPEYLRQAGLTLAQTLGRLEPHEIEAIEFAAHELHNPTIN